MSTALAVTGKVTETAPIVGADRIQRATVDCGASGTWSGVVGKEVAPGMSATVFLQDALLPPDDRWAFMEKHHWRVRMARFKGVPSECLILTGAPDMPPGTDLTESLGVKKFEKPIPAGMSGEAIGGFPLFIPKTDETNFQAVEGWEELLAGGHWYATEKADGTSCTVWNDGAGMHVCSRNWELREFTDSGASNLYWRVARQYDLTRIPEGLALQFEIVGPGVQGNPMGLAGIEARAFGLYNYAEHWRVPGPGKLRHLCDELRIPLATELPIEPKAYTADELRRLAEIRYSNGNHGEGIVIRSYCEDWSFKVLNLLYKD